MHNGFVEVDKEKMSKSLGNFFTAREIFQRYEPEALRFAMMTVHYRSPLNFDVTLDDAGNILGFPLFEDGEKRVEYLYETRERLLAVDPARIVDAGEVPEGIARFVEQLGAALDDDLNMPLGVAALSGLLAATNELVEQSRRKKGTVARAAVEEAKKGFAKLGDELGLGTQDAAAFLLRIRTRRAAKRGIRPEDVDAKIVARREARDAREFAKADGLRDELVAMGIELMDGAQGTTWRIPG
jgi:cysteinyl-tRNA synthetase